MTALSMVFTKPTLGSHSFVTLTSTKLRLSVVSNGDGRVEWTVWIAGEMGFGVDQRFVECGICVLVIYDL